MSSFWSKNSFWHKWSSLPSWNTVFLHTKALLALDCLLSCWLPLPSCPCGIWLCLTLIMYESVCLRNCFVLYVYSLPRQCHSVSWFSCNPCKNSKINICLLHIDIWKYLKHRLFQTELLIKPLPPHATPLYTFQYYYLPATKCQTQKGGFQTIFNN